MRKWWRRERARSERERQTEAFWGAVARQERPALDAGLEIPDSMKLAIALDADLFYESVISNWAMSPRTRSASGADAV